MSSSKPSKTISQPVGQSKLAKLKIYKIRTDDGRHALAFSFGKKRVAITFDDYIDNERAAKKLIQKITGELIVGKNFIELRRFVEEAILLEGGLAVTKSGFGSPREPDGPPEFYTFPTGKIVTASGFDGKMIWPTFSKDSQWERRGDAAEYSTQLSKALRDQPIPLLIFLTALAPVIKPFCGHIGYFVENYVVELTGETTAGKSTLAAQLAGSVWGGGPSKLGYGQSWNATENDTEMVASAFHNRLLVLDESTVADKSKSRRAENIFNLVHRISLGQTKGRMNGPSRVHFDTVVISTSNDSLASFLDESAQAAAAAEVRLFTIGVPDRETGFFATVPKEFDSVADALVHIRQNSSKHFGVLSEVFIRRVMNAANIDWPKFLHHLKLHFIRFFEAAGVNQKSELEMRKAKPFALAYAAGCIAKQCRLLPKDEWGSFLVPIVTAWREYNIGLANRQPMSPLATIEGLLTDDTKRFLLIPETKVKAKMSDEFFSRFDGFGIHVNGRLHLGIPPSKFGTLFANGSKLIDGLANENLLHANDGKRFKKRIRNDEDGVEKNERFYAIRVDEDLLRAACSRSS